MDLIRCENLSKRFGALEALHAVSLSLAPGEVVGLAGRSGAGKTVLLQIMAGLLRPSAGSMSIEGRRLRWPFAARSLGVGLIPQQPALAEGLDITANLFLGAEEGWPGRGGWLKIPRRRVMEEEARAVLGLLDVHFPSLRERAANLSSEERQLLAIARLAARPPRLILADDPASMLSYAHQQRFLGLVRAWQSEGRAVVFSSGNLDHLFAVTDRIVVLRQGRLVASLRTDATSREEVMAALVGTTDHRQLTPIIWALDSYHRAREQAERLRHRQSAREVEPAAGDGLTQQLIDQLAEQVSALDSANLALQDAQRRLLTEREQERKALARELHDQVIQDLLGINYALEDIAADGPGPDMADELGEIRTSIRELVDSIRRICGDLRPPTIDSLGLGAAIRSYTREWSARCGVAVSLDLDESLERLPEAIELSIFRIVQESLANVRKYAHAGEVRISLKHTSPRSLRVTIADDGRGLPGDPDLAALAAQGHYGLLGISERVALMEGRLRIRNQERGGLLIEAEIPHPRGESGKPAAPLAP